MKYGWITVNITDMWNKPKYNSERINQLLFADIVRIKEERDKFYLVEKYDCYQGWVDKRFVDNCSLKDYKQFKNEKKYVIKSKSIAIQDNNINPLLLYYGTTFPSVTKLNNGKVKIKLPNNTSILLPASCLTPIPKLNKQMVIEIIKEAKRFLGVPYLWGGITTTGFDCSGFTQTIFSRFGVNIPRDTKDQIDIGKEVSRENIKKGDLLFFKRHVGIATGKETFIHSSIGGGGVRINSLNKDNEDYRLDLDKSYKMTRRVL